MTHMTSNPFTINKLQPAQGGDPRQVGPLMSLSRCHSLRANLGGLTVNHSRRVFHVT